MSADRPVGRRWGGESPGVVRTVLLPAAGHPERGDGGPGIVPESPGQLGNSAPSGGLEGEAYAKVQCEKAVYRPGLRDIGHRAGLRQPQRDAIYSNNASYYAEKMKDIAALGTDILGGCCGTTPEYIALLSGELQDVPKAAKKIENVVTQEVTRTPSIFEEKLSRGEKAYIVELDPPFSEDASKVMKGAEDLRKCNVDLITLSDSPMARARMDAGQLAVKIQQKTGVAVMPHISCRDRNVIALRAGLLGMHMNDVRHFLIVTGDPVSRADRERVTSVFDFNSIKLMQYVKEMNLEVFAQEPVYYGGALNYHGANPDAIIERMKRKAEAGCGYFLTQPVYTEEDVERLTYIKEHIDTKIMCGIMPLVSYKNAMFVKNEMPGIHVSDEIVNRYREDMTREEAEEVAIELSVEIAAKLYDIADGFYFMTPFNRTGLIARIIEAIRQEEERR